MGETENNEDKPMSQKLDVPQFCYDRVKGLEGQEAASRLLGESKCTPLYEELGGATPLDVIAPIAIGAGVILMVAGIVTALKSTNAIKFLSEKTQKLLSPSPKANTKETAEQEASMLEVQALAPALAPALLPSADVEVASENEHSVGAYWSRYSEKRDIYAAKQFMLHKVQNNPDLTAEEKSALRREIWDIDSFACIISFDLSIAIEMNEEALAMAQREDEAIKRRLSNIVSIDSYQLSDEDIQDIAKNADIKDLPQGEDPF